MACLNASTVVSVAWASDFSVYGLHEVNMVKRILSWKESFFFFWIGSFGVADMVGISDTSEDEGAFTLADVLIAGVVAVGLLTDAVADLVLASSLDDS